MRSTHRPAAARAHRPRSGPGARRAAPTCSCCALLLQATDQLLTAQLLDRPADGSRVALARFDQCVATLERARRIVRREREREPLELGRAALAAVEER